MSFSRDANLMSITTVPVFSPTLRTSIPSSEVVNTFLAPASISPPSAKSVSSGIQSDITQTQGHSPDDHFVTINFPSQSSVLPHRGFPFLLDEISLGLNVWQAMLNDTSTRQDYTYHLVFAHLSPTAVDRARQELPETSFSHCRGRYGRPLMRNG